MHHGRSAVSVRARATCGIDWSAVDGMRVTNARLNVVSEVLRGLRRWARTVPLSVADISIWWWRPNHMAAIVRCGRFQRHGEAPRVIQRAVCPRERVERPASGRRWRAFQGDLAEKSFALAPALFAESLGRVMDCKTDSWIYCRIRIRRRIEPDRERAGAGLEPRGRLPATGPRRNSFHGALERRQMIQRVAEPDETNLHRAGIERLERDRLEEVVDLLDRLCLRRVLDRRACE